MPNIYFDMDGTIADLYGVENWLDDLRAERTRPYVEARPLVNFSQLARLLNKLIIKGYTINIISWTSRGGTANYNEQVKQAKLVWIKKHLPSVTFTSIHIVPYGTPKQTLGSGILFDDEENNRKNWGKNAYDETQIFKILKNLP